MSAAVDPPPLTPFIASRRASAEAAFAEWIRVWVGAPAASVDFERAVSSATPGPTRIVVRTATARLGVILRIGPFEGWRAGPVAVTVERTVDGQSPTSTQARGWLQRLASWFDADAATLTQRGATLARIHHAWASTVIIEDKHYRHVEKSMHGANAFLRPTFRCSQDCDFCWQGRDWPDAPTELVFRWLDELAAARPPMLTICGGEPTLFRELPALVERAAHVHRMLVHMDTNAIRLRDPAYAAMLRERGLASVLVSFHSADHVVSDAMTRSRGTWRKTVDGIHAALRAGLIVGLNCVVERSNVEGLERHAQFVRDEFVAQHPENPVRVVNYSQPGKYYDGALFLDRMVALEVARRHLTLAAKLLDAAGVALEITGSCGFPACAASDAPAIVPWRSNETHDAAHASGRTRRPAPCTSCAAQGHCVGIRREYLDRFGEVGLRPFVELPTSKGLPLTISDARWAPTTRAVGNIPDATGHKVRLPLIGADRDAPS